MLRFICYKNFYCDRGAISVWLFTWLNLAMMGVLFMGTVQSIIFNFLLYHLMSAVVLNSVFYRIFCFEMQQVIHFHFEIYFKW